MNLRAIFFLLGITILTATYNVEAGGRNGGSPDENGNGAAVDTLTVEGAVVTVDMDANAVVVQTDEGIMDTISITEQTVFDEGINLPALQPGQRLRFHYIEYDDRRVATRVEVIEPAEGETEEEW